MNDPFFADLEANISPKGKAVVIRWDVLVIVATFVAFMALMRYGIVNYVAEAPPQEAQAAAEPILQASLEDVTVFATTFLERLGYDLQGTVDCDRWEVAGNHKQYTCYAVVHPGWRRLTVLCGPAYWAAPLPLRLGCLFPSKD